MYRAVTLGMEVATPLLLLMAFSLSQSAPLEYEIMEEQNGTIRLGNVAGDGGLGRKFDRSTLRQLRYSFLQEQDPLTKYFAIDAVSGEIKAVKLIDRDALCAGLKDCNIKLDVAVKPAKFFQIIKVIVHVKDLNDNSPKFPEGKISRHISEGAPPDKTISIPTAVDPDSPTYGIQEYRIETLGSVFKLNTITSIDGSVDLLLVLKGELDRESEPYIIVNITAMDGGSRPRMGRLSVNVTIDDANDNVARFINSSYEFRVKESTPPDSVIAQVKATDEDLGLNGKISYSFGSRTVASFGKVFQIQKNTGSIVLKQKLDYEKVKEYRLTVIARDRGPNSQPSQATVNIIVVDINDHAPAITVNTFIKTGRAQVLENSKPGTFVAHVSVDDKDGGRNGNFTCDINDSRFKLQKMYKTEFKVLTVIRFNREMQTQLTIAITCKDGAVNPKLSQKYIDIDIKDANDHIPQFLKGRYEAEIQENNKVDDFLVQVNATDQDVGENAVISYRIDRDYARLFKINPITGRVAANASYDRENVSEYRFRVLAVDHGNPAMTGTATVHLKILDVDDEGPKFSQENYAFGVLENGMVGAAVGKVIATDSDTAPFNELHYSIDWPKKDKDPIFVINANSGKVNTKKMLDREAQSAYHFVVKATSVKKPDISTSSSVTVYVADKNDNLPEFVVPMEPNNTVHISSQTPQGHAVYQTFARDLDSGGNAKISYSITGGNTDNTFRINKHNGVIFVDKTLTPFESQTFDLELKASDQGYPQLSSTATLYVTVNNSLDVVLNIDPNASFTSDNSSSYLSGINLTILISVSIVSVFLILVLALGIILLKCHEKRHKPPVRNGSVISLGETQEMLQHNPQNSVYDVKGIPDGQESPHMCHDGHHRGRHHHHLRPHKKEVSFNLSLEDSGCIDASPSPSPNGTKETQKNQQPAYQVHQLMTLLRKDEDQGSSCSADISASDSGRGTSEEGDNSTLSPSAHGSKGDNYVIYARHGKGPPPPVPERTVFTSAPGNPQLAEVQEELPPPPPPPPPIDDIQELPLPPPPFDPQDCSCSTLTRNSYRTKEPHVHFNLDQSKDSNHPSCAFHSGKKKNDQTPNKLKNGNYYNMTRDSQGQIRVMSPTRQCEDSRSRVRPGSATSRSGDSLADEMSTTSGSYTIDPDELCREIDDLFFSDTVV